MKDTLTGRERSREKGGKKLTGRMGRQLTEEAEKAKREINKTEEERTAEEGEQERRVFTKCFHYTGSGNRPHNHVGVGHELNKDE